MRGCEEAYWASLAWVWADHLCVHSYRPCGVIVCNILMVYARAYLRYLKGCLTYDQDALAYLVDIAHGEAFAASNSSCQT